MLWFPTQCIGHNICLFQMVLYSLQYFQSNVFVLNLTSFEWRCTSSFDDKWKSYMVLHISNISKFLVQIQLRLGPSCGLCSFSHMTWFEGRHTLLPYLPTSWQNLTHSSMHHYKQCTPYLILVKLRLEQQSNAVSIHVRLSHTSLSTRIWWSSNGLVREEAIFEKFFTNR